MFCNIFFLQNLASFRAGIPTHRQLQILNENAIVSLHDDTMTEEKVKVNVLANPDTLFLMPINDTVERINKYVINTLFGNQNVMGHVINGLNVPMAIYKNMTVIITENRYFLIFLYMILFSQMLDYCFPLKQYETTTSNTLYEI